MAALVNEIRRQDRDTIGPKWQIRFRDLHGWHRIEVRCFRCEHVREFVPEELKQLRLREDIEHHHVADLEDRMRCTKCDNRVNNSVSVFKLSRNV